MKLYLPVLLLSFICSLVCVPHKSEAKIKISPNISLEEEYTDNLFLEHENEDEEWITTIEPGVAIKFDSRWIDLSLDYSFRFTHYMNNDNLTDFDFEGGQRANLGTTFFEGRPFTLSVRGTISRETLDESENSSETNELINKSTVYNSTVNPQYRFRLGAQSSLVFGYIYQRTDHEDPRGDDSQGHTGTVSLVKELSTNTEISASYSYKINKSEDAEEYDEQTFSVGMNQQVGPRTTIALDGGYSLVEYENSDDDEESFTWSADVSYRLSAPITLSLLFTQDFENSSTEGLVKTRDASFTIAYVKDLFSSSLQTYWEKTDYLRTAREDKAIGGRFSLDFALYRNLSTGFDADYEQAEYVDVTDREVDKYSLGASLDYEFSRFLATLSYRYRVNDSEVNTEDYTENTVTLRVTARF